MTPDGVLTVTTPSGIPATSTPDRIRRAAARSRAWEPADLPLTTARVIRERPGRPPGDPRPQPEDDPPPS